MTPLEATYWEGVLERVRARPGSLWRRHSDAVNCALVYRWLPAQPIGRILKTDLFDEALGDGLYPLLAARCARVIGIDLAASLIAGARQRYPDLEALQADVRELPFPSCDFDVVVSNSTLDHFARRDDIATALSELFRVLEPGGRLIVSLDNAANPIVAVRNALPFPLLRRVGLVPYYVGATHRPRGLREALERTGFEVLEMTAVMHCPVVAVAIAGVLERLAAPELRSRFLGILAGFERLEGWPTRSCTGHFVAALAQKPASGRPRRRLG